MMVFWFSNKTAWKRMGRGRCGGGTAPRARPVACVGNGVGCIAGEAAAGAVVVVVVEAWRLELTRRSP